MNSFDTNLGSLLSGGVSSDRLKEIIGSHDVRTPRQAVATQTGILSLDLGLIGIPPGIMEVYGPRSVGKTPMLAAILAFAQKTGMEGCFVATEPFDKDRMTKIGVDLDNLPVLRGGDSRLFQEMVSFLEHNERGILVIDSFTGLRPREDMEPRRMEQLRVRLAVGAY
jgi:RecA/RadA recombinase